MEHIGITTLWLSYESVEEP